MGDIKFARLGRVTSASVLKCTGKTWDEWVALLDQAGARSWTHQEIVAFLKKRHKLGPWWQQGVTTGYELAIGRRAEGQNTKGEYMVTATKSLHAGARKVWTTLLSAKGQKAWLQPMYKITLEPGHSFETSDGFFGEVRTMKTERNIRMTWQDPNWEKKTVLQVMIVDRPAGKSILVFNHSEIKTPSIQGKMRARWRAAAEAVAKLLSK